MAAAAYAGTLICGRFFLEFVTPGPVQPLRRTGMTIVFGSEGLFCGDRAASHGGPVDGLPFDERCVKFPSKCPVQATLTVAWDSR